MKEGALRTLGLDMAADQDLALRVCGTFFEEIELLVRNGVSLVAEAAFQHKVWAPRLAPLMGIADIRIVVCEVPLDIAVERRREREQRDLMWARYHPSPEGWETEAYHPPELNVPTLRIDTSLSDQPQTGTIRDFLT
jgi:hypothetical protein